MPRIQESAGKFTITLPREMVRLRGWVKGQEVLLTWNERGNIEIRENFQGRTKT